MALNGGKQYLASRILALMPRRKSPDNPAGWCHYVEPFAGGLSVLLAQDPEGISEVVNDKNGALSNLWRVLCSPRAYKTFVRLAQPIPFSEDVYNAASDRLGKGCDMEPGAACVICATAFFVVCRQSLAGRMKSFAPLSRTRVRRGMNEQVSAWLTAVEGLPDVHERMKRVVVLNRDALDVIRQQDGPNTLFYLDPPYLHETRATTKDYAHEMTREQHAALLDALDKLQGKFLLSGYRSDLYDEHGDVCGWFREDVEVPNNAAVGDSKRRMTECVWMNYEPGVG